MSELHNMAGHLVRRLNQISVAVFADHMTRIGVDLTPVQYAALTTINETPGMDQASLAGAIAYDKATLGGVVDRLAGKGLIERKKSETDRRARVLEITPAGKALLTRVQPVVRALQDDILAGLDSAEKSQLLKLLTKTTTAGNTRSRAPLKPPA
ncbi:MarR family transcriptional regulator [Alisedimentitalea sp. MJ-SS2]|uniref:MarR family winged helix-turn-helix transcriptional regulator n=1 Tax=Aliisedimentitalea sp. MJ-SS2 TaxID=3049795 RepID=UPI00291531F7|nr:MarR family transcriptional regulator [Alisedimentitalea sp. MJ-SS2]MDU8927235.1 MarR family transcriptional regulator [Alisedimentitalea sp. MJ-SS2]